jgi:ATP-dependent Lon protease
MLPAANIARDLHDLPDEVRDRMVITPITTMDDVLSLALLPATAGAPIVVDADIATVRDRAEV